MEYPKRSVNGDAGEYFVAYKITQLFGWPCRLFGIDLGVDAEAEVMTNGVTDGDIIKIQVKTFESMSSALHHVYVDDRHIEYWKKFCLPVIVCCVDLAKEKIYWQQITVTEAFQSGGVSRRITFDTTRHELTAASEGLLLDLVMPAQVKNIDAFFKEIMKEWDELPEDYISPDYDYIEGVEKKCLQMRQKIDQINNLIMHYPWKLSPFAKQQLALAERAAIVTEGNCSRVHAGMVNGM